MNAETLISSSMRLIGALAAGETLDASEAADGLMILNQMMDSWIADRLMCFTINIQEFPLNPSQQVYTMGPGGDFNVPRPAKIERISIVSLANPAQPLELPMEMLTDLDWQQEIPVKQVPGTLPLQVYDDGAFPLRNLSYFTIPTIPVNTRIYSWQALNQFPDLVTDLTFPPGYAEALRYNLAVRLIAEMPGEYAQITVQMTGGLAADTLARVRVMNMPLIQSFCDPALSSEGAHYDYRSDSIVGGRH